MRIVLCAALLGLATAARAADWQLVSQGLSAGDTVKDYVDASTLRQGGRSTVRYSRMTRYSPPRQSRGLDLGARRTQETVDCLARTVTVDSVVYFDDDGRPLGELRPKSLSRPIAPDSTADAIRQFVCPTALQR
jgi:hypothetical protein